MDPAITIKKEFVECDVDDALSIGSNGTSLEKKKRHKRKKIRRLAASVSIEKDQNLRGKRCKRILITTSLIIFIIALTMGHYCLTQNDSSAEHIIKQFLRNYRNQYKEIVHGQSNYCDQNQQLDTAKIFARIKETTGIIHQDEALNQVQLALRNESSLNTIVLVGPVGVGKTLFTRALQENFQWQENVHTYAFNTYVHDEAKKFHLIRILIQNLSECGQNLMVIYNLQGCDYGLVDIVNKMVLESIKKQRKRVILFYVFNLNTMLTREAYVAEKKLLQDLPDCNVITFKEFTRHELKDCIKREAEIENVTLTGEAYDEIVKTIDPSKSGCKNVNAKVLTYGRIKS